MDTTPGPDRGDSSSAETPADQPPRRTALLIGAALVAVVALGGLAAGAVLLSQDDDGGPLHLEIVVPAGTADLLAAGENVELIPALLEFEVGDSLTIINDDDTVHNVGPYTVGPFQKIEQPFPEPGTIEGLCSIHPSGQVTIVVR